MEEREQQCGKNLHEARFLLGGQHSENLVDPLLSALDNNCACSHLVQSSVVCKFVSEDATQSLKLPFEGRMFVVKYSPNEFAQFAVWWFRDGNKN